MNRLNRVKKFIKLNSKNDHIEVIIKGHNNRTIKQITSISLNYLNEFEKDAIIIHVYKLFTETNSNCELKERLNICNYAEVFGSPWEMK